MQYYLVICEMYPNGKVIRQDQIKLCALKPYDIIISVDTAMVSLTREATTAD